MEAVNDAQKNADALEGTEVKQMEDAKTEIDNITDVPSDTNEYVKQIKEETPKVHNEMNTAKQKAGEAVNAAKTRDDAVKAEINKFGPITSLEKDDENKTKESDIESAKSKASAAKTPVHSATTKSNKATNAITKIVNTANEVQVLQRKVRTILEEDKAKKQYETAQHNYSNAIQKQTNAQNIITEVEAIVKKSPTECVNDVTAQKTTANAAKRKKL